MTNTLTYYNTNTSSFVKSTQSVQMTEAWNIFTSKIPTSSIILDFGCIFGRDTKYFLEHGYQVEATDGSEESFATLIKKSADFEIIEIWITGDVRPGRENEKWLNVILQKK